MHNTLRERIKKVKVLQQTLYTVRFLRYLATSEIAKSKLFLTHYGDFRLISNMRKEVPQYFPKRLNLRNRVQWYFGKNILGYPAMAFLESDGEFVGWSASNLRSGG